VQTYSENLQKRSQETENAESLYDTQPENFSEMGLIKQLEQQITVRFGQEGGQSDSSEQRSQQELELLEGLQKLKGLLKRSNEDQD
jgi:translation initiation factor 2B subunit (eIF-2B alpha/beta/delta family)